MNPRTRAALVSFASSFLLLSPPAQSSTWLDQACMVAAQGSTAQVTEFALDGPAPWLYLDLSFDFDPAASSGLATVWFTADFSRAGLVRINDAPAAYPSTPSDQLWVEATNWNSVKALGAWQATPGLNYFDCIIIYGVGTCSVGVTPGDLVNFSVVTALAPVPEPSTLAFTLAGLGLVGWRTRARWHQNKITHRSV